MKMPFPPPPLSWSLSRFPVNIKRMGVLLFLPGWDASPSQVYPPIPPPSSPCISSGFPSISPVPIYTPRWGGGESKVSFAGISLISNLSLGVKRTDHKSSHCTGEKTSDILFTYEAHCNSPVLGFP